MPTNDANKPAPKKGRPAKPETPGAATRRTVNLSLSEAAWKRGNTHAAVQGTSVSALVDAFLLTLPEYQAIEPKPKKP